MRGLWFLPHWKKKRVHGEIHHSKDGIELMLRGSLDNPGATTTIVRMLQKQTCTTVETILGISEDGKKITLTDCSQINYHGTHGGLESETYRVFSMYVGAHFHKKSQIVFDNISIRYSNLYEWFGTTGIKHNFKMKGMQLVLSHKHPKPIRGKLSSGFGYKIYYTGSWPSLGFHKSYTISEDVNVEINSDSKLPLAGFMRIHTRIKHFFMLGISDAIHPLSVWSNLHNQANDKIYIFSAMNFFPEKIYEKRADQMLFSFYDVSKKFNRHLQKWFKAYDRFDDAFGDYFSTSINPYLYPQTTFQNLVQTLEAYHRHKFKTNREKKREFEKEVTEMLNLLSKPKHKKYIERFKKIGSEPSLPERLHALIRLFPKVLEDAGKEKSKFVNDMHFTRNYHAHHMAELRKKATTDDSGLFVLNRKIQTLVEACIMSELPFDNKELQDLIIKRRKNLAQWRIMNDG